MARISCICCYSMHPTRAGRLPNPSQLRHATAALLAPSTQMRTTAGSLHSAPSPPRRRPRHTAHTLTSSATRPATSRARPTSSVAHRCGAPSWRIAGAPRNGQNAPGLPSRAWHLVQLQLLVLNQRKPSARAGPWPLPGDTRLTLTHARGRPLHRPHSGDA